MMTMDRRFVDTLLKGWDRKIVTKEECKYLLSFDERSDEAIFAASLADRFLRTISDNTAILNAQIGVQTGPCSGNCRFCNFNRTTYRYGHYLMDDDTLTTHVRKLTRHNDLRTISLMTTHDLDLDHLIRCIRLTKNIAGKDVRITVNTGDVTYDECLEMKKAGASGAYHACRMNEGKDTDLEPGSRIETIRNYLDAGFIVSTCTEPIGPETTIDDILDNFFMGMEIGVNSGSLMARVPVPGTPMSAMGMISSERFKFIRSVLFLSSTWYKKEPCIDIWDGGFFNGFNRFHAELGGNPRDDEKESENGIGHTIEFARRMAFANNYDKLLLPDNNRIALNVDYLMRTGSI